MRRAPADALRALAGMAIAASPPRLSTHPGRFLAVLRPPSRSSLTSNPHSAAAQPGPNFPRLRALALFGRLTAERAKSLVIASVQKPAHKPTIHTDRADCSTDNPGRASSTAL